MLIAHALGSQVSSFYGASLPAPGLHSFNFKFLSIFSRPFFLCSFFYEILRSSVFLLLSVYLLVFFLNMSAVCAPLSPFLHQLLVLLVLLCSCASPSPYHRHSHIVYARSCSKSNCSCFNAVSLPPILVDCLHCIEIHEDIMVC